MHGSPTGGGPKGQHQDGALHRGNAIGDNIGLLHQAGAKRSVLNAIRRTAAIQIDFIISAIFGNPGTLRQRHGITATELQCNRMLVRAKCK